MGIAWVACPSRAGRAPACSVLEEVFYEGRRGGAVAFFGMLARPSRPNGGCVVRLGLTSLLPLPASRAEACGSEEGTGR